MTQLMAYVMLITAGVAACVVVLETVARARAYPTRWFWIAALMLATGATAFAMFVPRRMADVEDATLTGPVHPTSEILRPQSARLTAGQAALRTADAVLPTIWVLASIMSAGLLLFGRRRFQIVHRASRRARIAGFDVQLTENLGPAVAGVRSPVVFVPRWVLALDEVSQRLLVAHELEHVKHRDTSLLLFGAATAVLMPWNPVVWWMVRRLRVCVEQDCDARVLANHPDVRRYADLLLTAASRKGAGGLLAAHLGERSSDLMRRLEAMTTVRRIPWNRALAATLVAVVLVIASCETPRPDPLSPAVKAQPSPATTSDFTEIKSATLIPGSPTPVYPAILREAGVEGEVLVSFTVNESGEVDPSRIEIVRSTHELFSVAVRKALPTMRFTPAESNGRKTSQTQEQPFTFSIVGNKKQQMRQDSSAMEILGVPGKKLAYTVRRADLTSRTLNEKVGAGPAASDRRDEQETRTPSILLRGSKSLSQVGSPLVIVDGIVMKGNLDDIDPLTIESIEVVKGAAAKSTYGDRAQGGVIQITTKQRRRVP